jgi:hypothetical protein
MTSLVLSAPLMAVFCYVLYLVVRAAVRDGIEEAADAADGAVRDGRSEFRGVRNKRPSPPEASGKGPGSPP